MPTGVYERTAEHKKKLSLAHIGKKWSDKNKRLLSESHKGQVPWNKGLLGWNNGHAVSPELRQILSRVNKGNKHALGCTRSDETKRKMRTARIALIEQNYGICWPAYNKKACEYFKKFDTENNTHGRYAVYGGGEYKIEELGYFVDYINFEKKLIMEWDESHHYKEGNLRSQDIVRQKEIQELFPDFEFRRITD